MIFFAKDAQENFILWPCSIFSFEKRVLIFLVSGNSNIFREILHLLVKIKKAKLKLLLENCISLAF